MNALAKKPNYGMEFQKDFLMKLAERGYIHKSLMSKKRNYAAGVTSRLTAGWTTTIRSADAEIKDQLKAMRARSRELAINNDYARKFLKMVIANIVGSNGISMQSKATEFNGQLDKNANDTTEAAWKKWGKKGVCTVDGQLSWIDVQKLTVLSVARDGEVLIRKVKGFDNEFGFALQLIEADHLDENLNNAKLPNGNSIRMGIEYNEWDRPVAYHIRVTHPGEYLFGSSFNYQYERIPAEEVIHLYIQERVRQSRGVPWMHSAMTRLNMIGGYEEAELVASRAAAAKMGIIKTPTGSEYVGDDNTSKGDVITEAEPGAFEQLPAGWDFEMFDPKHPGGNFEPFMKTVLRGAASGLNVAYNTFANDLEGVNYSSIRSGVLEERDQWRMLQGWLIEHLCADVYYDCLNMAFLSGVVKLPFAKFEKFHAPKWQGRGWPWVDPLKDMKANSEAIDLGVKSRTMIANEEGRDLEDIFMELKSEEEMAKKYGITLTTGGKITDKDIKEQENEEGGDKK